MDENENLIELHKSLVKKGYPVHADFSAFEKDMSNPENVKALHGSLVNKGFPVPKNYDEFASDMKPKTSDLNNPLAEVAKQFTPEGLKKKEDAKKESAGAAYLLPSSSVAAQTAPETYLPEKKKDLKDKKANDELNKFYDQATSVDPNSQEGAPLDMGKAYKAWLESNGKGDDLGFRREKVWRQQYNADVPLVQRLLNEGKWKSPEDEFSAPASRESFNMFREAYQFKSKLLKNKLDQFHSDPSTSGLIDEAFELKDGLTTIDGITSSGEYKGEKLNKQQLGAVNAKRTEYEARVKELKAKPNGVSAFTLIDNIDSLDGDEAKYQSTFNHFIEEDKTEANKQAEVNKLYADSPLLVKGAYSFAMPFGRAATSFASGILNLGNTIAKTISPDNDAHKHYNLGERWSDTVNDWKKNIDKEIFQIIMYKMLLS